MMRRWAVAMSPASARTGRPDSRFSRSNARTPRTGRTKLVARANAVVDPHVVGSGIDHPDPLALVYDCEGCDVEAIAVLLDGLLVGGRHHPTILRLCREQLLDLDGRKIAAMGKARRMNPPGVGAGPTEVGVMLLVVNRGAPHKTPRRLRLEKTKTTEGGKSQPSPRSLS